MDPVLKQKIHDKLLGYLNREPSDDEVINGQNDANLMHWIAQDDTAALKVSVDTLSISVAKPMV